MQAADYMSLLSPELLSINNDIVMYSWYFEFMKYIIIDESLISLVPGGYPTEWIAKCFYIYVVFHMDGVHQEAHIV